MAKATQDQGMTSQMRNFTIVASLVLMLLNVELLATIELKKMKTTLKNKVKKVTLY